MEQRRSGSAMTPKHAAVSEEHGSETGQSCQHQVEKRCATLGNTQRPHFLRAIIGIRCQDPEIEAIQIAQGRGRGVAAKVALHIRNQSHRV